MGREGEWGKFIVLHSIAPLMIRQQLRCPFTVASMSLLLSPAFPIKNNVIFLLI